MSDDELPTFFGEKYHFCVTAIMPVLKKKGGGRHVYLPTKKKTCVMVFEDVKHYVRAHEKDRG